MHGNVVSFINMKGGVSKTTLCKELGIFLGLMKNKRILFVDVDPQANLTQGLFRKYGYRQANEIYESEELKNKFITTDVGINRLIDSGNVKKANIYDVVLELEENISLIPGELGIDFTKRNLNSSELEGSLHKFINDNDLKSIYDFILIDCPPTYSSYITLALKASDAFIIPVRPESYSILGIDMLLKVVEHIENIHDIYFKDKPLRNLGVVFTNVKKTIPIGISNLIKEIRSSEIISDWNVNFFNTHFEFNSQIPKDIGYDIASSNSESSKQNMDILSEEFLNKFQEEII